VRRERLLASCWSIFIGDALAMPAHWIYDGAAQQRIYGTLRDYVPASREAHPDSWDYYGRIDVDMERDWPFKIFHNNRELYAVRGTNYHHALPAGDNTLHARLQEVLMESVVETHKRQAKDAVAAPAKEALPYSHEDFCTRFFDYLTTPGRHPDTYIGGALRHFFAAMAKDPTRSFDGKGYDDPCVGGLVLILPLLLLMASSDDALGFEQRSQAIHHNLFLTHASPLLYGMAVEMLKLVSGLTRRVESSPSSSAVAERLLREALQRMIQANIESGRDADAVCSFAPPRKGAKKKSQPAKEGDSDEVLAAVAATASATKAAEAASAAAVASALAPSDPATAEQDPVYLKWKAEQLLAAPNARVYSIDELLDMSDADAFAACFSVRCYAERALPGAVYLALKSVARPTESFADDPYSGPLLTNANLGGDNAHRGQLLGILLGALHGDRVPIPAHWKDDLRKQSGEHDKLQSLFEQFTDVATHKFA